MVSEFFRIFIDDDLKERDKDGKRFKVSSRNNRDEKPCYVVMSPEKFTRDL